MSKRTLLDRSSATNVRLVEPSPSLPAVAVAAAAAAAVAQDNTNIPTTDHHDELATTSKKRKSRGPTPENPHSKNNPPLDEQLFVPTRTKNKGNYVCIRLIGSPQALELGKPLTSDEAVGAWCLECRDAVWWKKGESNGISRHMARLHPDILRDAGVQQEGFSGKGGAAAYKRKRESEDAAGDSFSSLKDESGVYVPSSFKGPGHDMGVAKCSNADQAKFDAMTLLWVNQHFRPPSVVEDAGLKDMVTFAGSMHGEPDLCPDRQRLEEWTGALKSFCNTKMEQKIQSELHPHLYYSVTRDQCSFHKEGDDNASTLSAVAVHYVTTDFTHQTLYLQARTSSSLDNNNHNESLTGLSQWGLDTSKIATFIHGSKPLPLQGGDNVPETARSVSAIGYSLHQICGMFYSLEHAHGASNVVGDFSLDEHAIRLGQSAPVDSIRQIVSKLRAIFSLAQEDPTASFASDMPVKITDRWNDTHSMLDYAIKMQSEIDQWVTSIVDSSSRSLVISQQEWALIRGAWILLTPFHTLIQSLAMEPDPTMIYAIPFLRRVRNILETPGLLLKGESSSNDRLKFVKDALDKFLDDYGDEDFLAQVIVTLEACRTTLLKEFELYFGDLDRSFLWASMLDPRLRKLNHCSNYEERAQAKSNVLTEMMTLAGEWEALNGNTERVTKKEVPSPFDAMRDMFEDVFDDPGSGGNAPTAEDASKEANTEVDTALYTRKEAESELAQYLSAPSVHKSVSAFRWWKSNFSNYPMLARVARKYLSVLAMPSPSDRILTKIGLVNAVSRQQPGDDTRLDLKLKLLSLSLTNEEMAICLREAKTASSRSGNVEKTDIPFPASPPNTVVLI